MGMGRGIPKPNQVAVILDPWTSLGHGKSEIPQERHFKQGDVSFLLVLASRLAGTRRPPPDLLHWKYLPVL